MPFCWFCYILGYELQCEKTYRLRFAPNADKDQSKDFVVPHEGTLPPRLYKMQLVKILIRLHKCEGWSESSLGAWRYVFWRCGCWPRWLRWMRVRLVARRLRVRYPPGRQHFFVEIDHELFSTVILSLPLIQEGQLSVSCERMYTILVNRLED